MKRTDTAVAASTPDDQVFDRVTFLPGIPYTRATSSMEFLPRQRVKFPMPIPILSQFAFRWWLQLNVTINGGARSNVKGLVMMGLTNCSTLMVVEILDLLCDAVITMVAASIAAGPHGTELSFGLPHISQPQHEESSHEVLVLHHVEPGAHRAQ